MHRTLMLVPLTLALASCKKPSDPYTAGANLLRQGAASMRQATDDDSPLVRGGNSAMDELNRAAERKGEELNREAERIGERMNIHPGMTEAQIQREFERGAAQLQPLIEQKGRELEPYIERAAEAQMPSFDTGSFED
jgi:hypothetical protein